MNEFDLLIAEETLIADAQIYIHTLMKERGISKAELARILGVSKASVSQMLGQDSNMTLRRLARVTAVLGEQASVCERKSKPASESVEVERGRANRASEWSSNLDIESTIVSADLANDNREAVWGFEEFEILQPPKRKRRLVAA